MRDRRAADGGGVLAASSKKTSSDLRKSPGVEELKIKTRLVE